MPPLQQMRADKSPMAVPDPLLFHATGNGHAQNWVQPETAAVASRFFFSLPAPEGSKAGRRKLRTIVPS